MISCALVFTPSPKTCTMIRYLLITNLVEPNCKIIPRYSHPTYNERLLKIIKIDRLHFGEDKTTPNTKMTNEENEEQEVIIIEDII